MENPYKILGVSVDTSDEEIKKVYKKLALEWHPDRHKGDKNAEEKFKEINEAYNNIKNLKNKSFTQNSNFDDIFNMAFGGFNPFDGLFTESRKYKPKYKKAIIEISMEEAHNGCNKKITLNETVPCDVCNGHGYEITNEICTICNGNGRKKTNVGNIMQFSQPCSSCKGFGRKIGKKCNNCYGNGVKQISKDLNISIPSGLLYGQIINVDNIAITVKYEKHSKFRLIDGINDGKIGSDLTINIFDAILGNNIKIDTLSGEKTIKINPGTQPNTILRIKNGGIGNRADHLVFINIELPKELNNEQKALFEDLKNKMK